MFWQRCSNELLNCTFDYCNVAKSLADKEKHRIFAATITNQLLIKNVKV